MVKDHLGQGVVPGNFVFYHGNLYIVEKTTEGKGPVNNFVHMQYAAKAYELMKLKRVCSCEVCLVDTAVAKAYIDARWKTNPG
jgi:hypothetical protein